MEKERLIIQEREWVNRGTGREWLDEAAKEDTGECRAGEQARRRNGMDGGDREI